jgi:hypothetical protein
VANGTPAILLMLSRTFIILSRLSVEVPVAHSHGGFGRSKLIVRTGLLAPSCSRCLCLGWSHFTPGICTAHLVPVTNAIERLNEEFHRRIKTQTVLPCAETVPMLLWALQASGQIQMRKVDGWETLVHPSTRCPLTSPPDHGHLIPPDPRHDHSLPWVADMVFRDDECRLRTDHAPANFTTISTSPST